MELRVQNYDKYLAIGKHRERVKPMKQYRALNSKFLVLAELLAIVMAD